MTGYSTSEISKLDIIKICVDFVRNMVKLTYQIEIEANNLGTVMAI